MTEPWTSGPTSELWSALAQRDAAHPDGAVRQRTFDRALSRRRPGHPLEEGARIDGRETFSRQTRRLANLLSGLEAAEWMLPTIRGLDVQGLVGHLIGVERDFSASLENDASVAAADHLEATRAEERRQRDRAVSETLADWHSAASVTIGLLEDADPEQLVRFHGVVLPLDQMLVVRAFEMWTHEEDIERAAGRALTDPDPDTLRRMTDLATELLPAGINGRGPADGQVRLVLTGPGGGSWDVVLPGGETRRAGHGLSGAGENMTSLAVVDAAMFCRVVANRADLSTSRAVHTGAIETVRSLFEGASTLALD